MGHVVDIRSKKFGRTGPKPKEYSDRFLQSVPLHKRTTERSFAAALKVSHVTVHRLKKRGKLKSHTSNNHPSVTPSHKLARMQWVLSHLTIAENSVNHTFFGMYNVIQIDEKWFYLNLAMRRFYLLPSEDDPYRCQQSKRYKIKAMFMGVISRPIFDQEGNMIHDGKYGIFPFIYHERAKKNSKNRAAGTMETKEIQNISRDVIRDMLLQKVIPAIMDRWPQQMGKEIIIQWDNARPHQIPTDEQFRQATTENGFDIKLVFHPLPQSPDLNVLDLGLFRTIQSLQYQSLPKNLNELIDKVKESYDLFDPMVNKYTWLTLLYCMVEILKVEGGNNYKIPHVGKRRLESLGILPRSVKVCRSVVNDAMTHLNNRLRPIPQHRQQQQNEDVDAD